MRKIRAFKRREKCNAIIVSNLLGQETDRNEIAAAVPNDHTTQMLALTFMLDNIGGVFSDPVKHIGDLLIAGQGDACIAGIGCIENETAIGAGQPVQSEDILMLLQESLYLGLLPAPTLSQILQSQKNSVFAVLTNRSKKKKTHFWGPWIPCGTKDQEMRRILRIYSIV